MFSGVSNQVQTPNEYLQDLTKYLEDIQRRVAEQLYADHAKKKIANEQSGRLYPEHGSQLWGIGYS